MEISIVKSIKSTQTAQIPSTSNSSSKIRTFQKETEKSDPTIEIKSNESDGKQMEVDDVCLSDSPLKISTTIDITANTIDVVSKAPSLLNSLDSDYFKNFQSNLKHNNTNTLDQSIDELNKIVSSNTSEQMEKTFTKNEIHENMINSSVMDVTDDEDVIPCTPPSLSSSASKKFKFLQKCKQQKITDLFSKK